VTNYVPKVTYVQDLHVWVPTVLLGLLLCNCNRCRTSLTGCLLWCIPTSTDL